MKYQTGDIVACFDNRKFEFVGDHTIECHCLSNGGKCDQRNMERIETNPFTIVSDKATQLCIRMWKEVA